MAIGYNICFSGICFCLLIGVFRYLKKKFANSVEITKRRHWGNNNRKYEQQQKKIYIPWMLSLEFLALRSRKYHRNVSFLLFLWFGMNKT